METLKETILKKANLKKANLRKTKAFKVYKNGEFFSKLSKMFDIGSSNYVNLARHARNKGSFDFIFENEIYRVTAE